VPNDIAGFGLDYKVRLEFGPGRVAALGELAAGIAAPGRPLLLISDRGVAGTGLVDEVAAALRASGHAVTTVAELAGEPHDVDVDRHAALVRSERPGLVVALGGGSALDLAKLAASVGNGRAGAAAYALGARPLPSSVPVVAVPTTAGTGAEITRTAVFSAGGRKLWAWGPELRPALAVLDPELTVGLPKPLTVACGLDALVHGIEAATGQRRTPLSEAYGLRAVGLGFEHLPVLAHRPKDLAARGGMLLAACLAGLAIDLAGTGLAHAVGHALGTVRGVAHGPAVALGLTACLGWNVAGAPDRYRELARALGLAEAADASSYDLARALERRWRGLVGSAGAGLVQVAHTLDPDRDRRALGAALRAPENQPMVQANARPVDETDLDGLLDRLFDLRAGLP